MANKATYMPFLQQTDDEQYCHIVDTFRYSGMFSGDMGDLIIKALANVLKTPLIILTNINNYNIITVTHDEFIDTNHTIFLTFTRDGPGHYDAVVDSSPGLTDENCGREMDTTKRTRCTCGMTRKEAKDSCTNKEAENGRKYSSRCHCLKNKQSCGDSCRCKGGKNLLGNVVKEVSEYHLGKKTRRRAKINMGGERKDGLSFMRTKNEDITYGKWTDEENFLFLQHVALTPDLLAKDVCDVTPEKLTKTFNASVQEAENVLGNGNANPKAS